MRGGARQISDISTIIYTKVRTGYWTLFAFGFLKKLAVIHAWFDLTKVLVCVSAQKIHASSETYLALMKDNAYELQLRGEIEVKVNMLCHEIIFLCRKSYPRFVVASCKPFVLIHKAK